MVRECVSPDLDESLFVAGNSGGGDAFCDAIVAIVGASVEGSSSMEEEEEG
jgi:hypothetical protein